ncbi:MAG: hypothetical protein ACREHD_33995, partial [Pirellulales bacterium]
MFVVVVLTSGLLAGGVDECAWSSEDPSPAALAEGCNGVVVGVSGPAAVHVGLETLKNGGSAADASLATALSQVVECGGCYV